MPGWVRTVKVPATGRALPGLLAKAQRDAELAKAWRERLLEPLRVHTRQIVARAVTRGELATGLEGDVLLDRSFGPLFTAGCFRGTAPY